MSKHRSFTLAAAEKEMRRMALIVESKDKTIGKLRHLLAALGRKVGWEVYLSPADLAAVHGYLDVRSPLNGEIYKGETAVKDGVVVAYKEMYHGQGKPDAGGGRGDVPSDGSGPVTDGDGAGVQRASDGSPESGDGA